MLLAYSGGARMVDTRMVEAAVTEYDSLFSTLRSQAPGGNDAPIRRWLGRVLEAVALRMLALARTLNPHEIRAFDDEPESVAAPQADRAALEKPGTMAQTS
jgi:hypothetical protein